jgi:hypothetical protein
LREFCGGGNSEPNKALKNIERSEISSSQLTMEPATPYLFPKEARKIKRTCTMAKAEQAGEHGE